MTNRGDPRRVSSRFGNVLLHLPKLFVVALAVIVVPVAGAPRGPLPPAKGARWTWPKGVAIVVRVADDLSTVEGGRVAIESAFKKWEDAGRMDGNGSGVTFSFEAGAPGTVLTYHVAYGRVRAGGQAHTLMLSSPSGVFVAWTVIDRRVTDPVALSHVMAHEIGHTFGLAECDACAAGSSVMTRFNGDYNDVTSGRNAPSDVDNMSVRANGGYRN